MVVVVDEYGKEKVSRMVNHLAVTLKIMILKS